MPPVSLKRVVDALDRFGESEAYLNRVTGEIYETIETDEWLDEPEEEDLQAELKADQEKRAEIELSEDWVPLPTKFDINEYDIMRDFSLSREGDLQDELLRAIRGSGAFRRFKDAVHRHGVQNDWYAFRDESFRAIAINWLSAHEIPYEA